jgi:hypothetical protein
MYYTPEIIDMIAKHTNNYAREPKNELLPYTCANQWYPTCRGELYIYFAIYIYMTLYIINKISDYWDRSKITPAYAITSYMLRNRFQELHMRIRLAGTDAKGAYAKVSKAPLISLLFFIRF